MAQLQHFFLACHRQGFDATKVGVQEVRISMGINDQWVSYFTYL